MALRRRGRRRGTRPCPIAPPLQSSNAVLWAHTVLCARVIFVIFIDLSVTVTSARQAVVFETSETSELSDDDRCSVHGGDETKVHLPDGGHPIQEVLALEVLHLRIEGWSIHMGSVDEFAWIA